MSSTDGAKEGHLTPQRDSPNVVRHSCHSS